MGQISARRAARVLVSYVHSLLARNGVQHLLYDFTANSVTRCIWCRVSTPRSDASRGPRTVAARSADPRGGLVPGRTTHLWKSVASALDPTTPVFSESNLPPGASFDSGTGIFSWRPFGDQAGEYSGTVFTATASNGSINETVDFSVTERVPSATGRVVLGDGSPLPGAVLCVRGTVDRRSTVVADENGAYRIDSTISGKRLKPKLAKPTRKLYRTIPKAIVVVASAGDMALPDLVAQAK